MAPRFLRRGIIRDDFAHPAAPGCTSIHLLLLSTRPPLRSAGVVHCFVSFVFIELALGYFLSMVPTVGLGLSGPETTMRCQAPDANLCAFFAGGERTVPTPGIPLRLRRTVQRRRLQWQEAMVFMSDY